MRIHEGSGDQNHETKVNLNFEMGLEILEESGSNRVTKMVRFGSGLRKKPLGRDFGEMVRVERWGWS